MSPYLKQQTLKAKNFFLYPECSAWEGQQRTLDLWMIDIFTDKGKKAKEAADIILGMNTDEIPYDSKKMDDAFNFIINAIPEKIISTLISASYDILSIRNQIIECVLENYPNEDLSTYQKYIECEWINIYDIEQSYLNPKQIARVWNAMIRKLENENPSH